MFSDTIFHQKKNKGAVLTIFALGKGLSSMRKGDAQSSQRMMRLRIKAQGFTVLALVAGTLYKPIMDTISSWSTPVEQTVKITKE